MLAKAVNDFLAILILELRNVNQSPYHSPVDYQSSVHDFLIKIDDLFSIIIMIQI